MHTTEQVAVFMLVVLECLKGLIRYDEYARLWQENVSQLMACWICVRIRIENAQCRDGERTDIIPAMICRKPVTAATPGPTAFQGTL